MHRPYRYCLSLVSFSILRSCHDLDLAYFWSQFWRDWMWTVKTVILPKFDISACFVLYNEISKLHSTGVTCLLTLTFDYCLTSRVLSWFWDFCPVSLTLGRSHVAKIGGVQCPSRGRCLDYGCQNSAILRTQNWPSCAELTSQHRNCKFNRFLYCC